MKKNKNYLKLHESSFKAKFYWNTNYNIMKLFKFKLLEIVYKFCN